MECVFIYDADEFAHCGSKAEDSTLFFFYYIGMDNIEADIDVLFDSYFNTLSVMHNSNHKRIIDPSLKLTAATTAVVSQLRK